MDTIWLDTGDLGLFTKNGDLVIIGREKDRLVINGIVYYSTQIEVELKKHISQIQECSVTSQYNPEDGTDQLVIRFWANASDINKKIKYICYYKLNLPVFKILEYTQDTFPKTHTNKIKRHFDNSATKETSTKENLTKGLNNITDLVRQYFENNGVNYVSAEDNLFQLGMDSLKLVELQQLINSNFGVNLGISFYLENNTLEKLELYFKNKNKKIINKRASNNKNGSTDFSHRYEVYLSTRL